MAITIEHLDDHHRRKNSVIITGEGLLLRFEPEKSVFHQEKSLRQFIYTKDLLGGNTIEILDEIIRLSGLARKCLGKHIEMQEKFDFSPDLPINFHPTFEELKDNIEQIKTITSKIKTQEYKFQPILSKDHALYFCNNCGAYCGETGDFVPPTCNICKAEVKREAPPSLVATFLDHPIGKYLEGAWFEDYTARLLKRIGFQTWCHGSVMGASGISHPLDLLAVDARTQKVAVAECKTGRVSDKLIFSFISRWSDMKCPYGFFIMIDDYPNTPARRLVEKTPGLAFIDCLLGLNDNEIIEKIEKVFYHNMSKKELLSKALGLGSPEDFLNLVDEDIVRKIKDVFII